MTRTMKAEALVMLRPVEITTSCPVCGSRRVTSRTTLDPAANFAPDDPSTVVAAVVVSGAMWMIGVVSPLGDVKFVSPVDAPVSVCM